MEHTLTTLDLTEFAMDHRIIESLVINYLEGGRTVGSKTAIKKMKDQWDSYDDEDNIIQALLWLAIDKKIYKILFKNKKPSEESINKAFTSFLSSKYAK